jgi:hypothetical protein
LGVLAHINIFTCAYLVSEAKECYQLFFAPVFQQ